MFGALRIRNDRHDIVDTELTHRLQREFPHIPVFLYRHRQTENFMVAKWIDRDRRYAVEIANLGKSLANVTADTIQDVRRRMFTSITREEIAKVAATQASAADEANALVNEQYNRLHHSRPTQVGWTG